MPDWALPASKDRGLRINQSTLSFDHENGAAKSCVDSPYSKLAFIYIKKGDDHYEY